MCGWAGVDKELPSSTELTGNGQICVYFCIMKFQEGINVDLCFSHFCFA